MLKQDEADKLISVLKRVRDNQNPINFPGVGEDNKVDLESEDGNEQFIVDINRKGTIRIARKCTFQGRYRKYIPLLRLDIGGPDHTNPDGEEINGDHVHIFKEGYGDRFAIPLPPDITNPDDLIQTLIDFLSYFNTIDADKLDIQTVI